MKTQDEIDDDVDDFCAELYPFLKRWAPRLSGEDTLEAFISMMGHGAANKGCERNFISCLEQCLDEMRILLNVKKFDA